MTWLPYSMRSRRGSLSLTGRPNDGYSARRCRELFSSRAYLMACLLSHLSLVKLVISRRSPRARAERRAALMLTRCGKAKLFQDRGEGIALEDSACFTFVQSILQSDDL